MRGTKRSVEVLLVDPNEEDVRLFRDSLQDKKILNQIHVVSDGADALDYLHQRGEHPNASRPNLILLEVDLPEMDGKDVLEELAGHDELKGIPVIVLTDSDKEEDVVKSYQLHVNAYIQKPIDPEEFTAVVRSIENFWLEIVRLPDPDPGEDPIDL